MAPGLPGRTDPTGPLLAALLVFDSGFLSALLWTILWTIVNMAVQLVLAFALASLLNVKKLRLRKL